MVGNIGDYVCQYWVEMCGWMSRMDADVYVVEGTGTCVVDHVGSRSWLTCKLKHNCT